MKLAWCLLLLPGCGGVESQGATDATVVDTGSDAAATCGDGDCLRGEVSFDGGCPKCEPGSVCVHKPAGPMDSTYCVKIPACCGSIPTCECIGACACAPMYYGGCRSATASDVYCDGPISIAAAKTDIHYITDEERTRLAAQALATPLATYRYWSEAEGGRSRLGFIIDDQPAASFAVAEDRTHVDLYGYASVLLATVQEQQATIEELRDRIARLENAAPAKRRRTKRAGRRAVGK